MIALLGMGTGSRAGRHASLAEDEENAREPWVSGPTPSSQDLSSRQDQKRQRGVLGHPQAITENTLTLQEDLGTAQ